MKISTRSLFSFIASIGSVSVANAELGFDIYGDSSIFNPSHSISVDSETCSYTAIFRINVADAGLPFPENPAEDCNPGNLMDPAFAKCDGQNCLYEHRNVYKFGKKFEYITGFNHIGLDWSPCGHPPAPFLVPHLNVHIFRVSTKEREMAVCDMAGPFTCKPLAEQTEAIGRKFYVHGRDINGDVANIPSTFGVDNTSAVPGEGVHVWDFDNVLDVPGDNTSWNKPILVMGLYDGGIQFWEPMFPFTFVSGSDANEHSEDVSYISQTIESLPSSWSLSYDPSDGYTTFTLNGKANACPKRGKSAKSPKRGKSAKSPKSARL